MKSLSRCLKLYVCKMVISVSGGWSFYILVLAVAVQSDIVIHLIGMGQAVTSLGLCCQSI